MLPRCAVFYSTTRREGASKDIAYGRAATVFHNHDLPRIHAEYQVAVSLAFCAVHIDHDLRVPHIQAMSMDA